MLCTGRGWRIGGRGAGGWSGVCVHVCRTSSLARTREHHRLEHTAKYGGFSSVKPLGLRRRERGISAVGDVLPSISSGSSTSRSSLSTRSAKLSAMRDCGQAACTAKCAMLSELGNWFTRTNFQNCCFVKERQRRRFCTLPHGVRPNTVSHDPIAASAATIPTMRTPLHHTSRVSLLLFPSELGRASKTSQFDDSVVLDSKNRSYLGALIQKAARAKAPKSLLFPFSSVDF